MLRPHLSRVLAILGLLAFILLAAGWSYAWVRGRDVVTGKFDAFLAREAQLGRIHECANRRIGGYPFLIEIRCDAPVIRFNDVRGQMAASFSSLKTVALVYAPRHVITELGSPLVVTQNEQMVFSATFKSAQASYRQNDQGLERFSFTADEWKLDTPISFSAAHMEFHIRPSDMPPAGSGHSYDFAFEADRLITPGSAPDQPMDVTLASAVRDWPDWHASAGATLDDWQSSEGAINIQELRIKRNDGLFVAKGDLRFNDRRRAEGRFEATFINSSGLLRGLIMQGQNDAGALFGPIFLMLGKQVEFEGKRGTSMQLKVNNGIVTLGTLVLGEIPPLY